MATAQTVLRAQAQALEHIAGLYSADAHTQAQFFLSLQYLHNAILSNGKIVITGMGKSFKIAEKLVATLNSLGIHAAPLHPSDALHGDLGVIKATDAVVLITASGNTPELLALVPHIPAGIPVLCLTNTPNSPLAAAHASATLSAHIPPHLSEKAVYGLPAPTTSTTACLAVGDAVCITLAEMLEADVRQRSRSFARWHPGGAIGKDFKKEGARKSDAATPRDDDDNELAHERRLHDIQRRIVPWRNVAQIETAGAPHGLSEVHFLRACTGKPWAIVDSRYLVATRPAVEALDGEVSVADVLTRDPRVPRKDLFLVHKHKETQLDTFDTDAYELALVLDAEGKYCGVYDGRVDED